MKVFKYNSSGSWEPITATLNYRYTPTSSTSTSSGTIAAITGTGGQSNAGALFSVQPNTQYKIVFHANITSATINPGTTTAAVTYYWIATDYGEYPKAATVLSGSISRQLVGENTEITVTTPANATHMVFGYTNRNGTASNRADTYFNARYVGANGFVSGWAPLPVKKRTNGSWTNGEVYISTNNVWIN